MMSLSPTIVQVALQNEDDSEHWQVQFVASRAQPGFFEVSISQGMYCKHTFLSSVEPGVAAAREAVALTQQHLSEPHS